MVQKPNHLSQSYAEVFQDASVAEAYIHRPPYPVEVFDVLAGLASVGDKPIGERKVLDVGCGTGDVARRLVERVGHVDAVDFSQSMLEQGRLLPNGDHPGLHWLYGRVEDVALDPPYALVTAGASLHWMDWNVVLPRFHDLLTPGGFLAVIEHNAVQSSPSPRYWFEALGEIIPRYSTNKEYQPYDMVALLEQYGLFRKVGEQETAPVPFTQSIDDFVGSYHSRNGFSRERMGPQQADAFDRGARELLHREYGNGPLELAVVAHIVWGYPLRPGHGLDHLGGRQASHS